MGQRIILGRAVLGDPGDSRAFGKALTPQTFLLKITLEAVPLLYATAQLWPQVDRVHVLFQDLGFVVTIFFFPQLNRKILLPGLFRLIRSPEASFPGVQVVRTVFLISCWVMVLAPSCRLKPSLYGGYPGYGRILTMSIPLCW